MKKIKSIIAMILAFVMIMGMSTMALAATKDNATIRVYDLVDGSNVLTGATLEYLQVIAPDETTLTGWAFINDAGTEYVSALAAEAIMKGEVGAEVEVASAEQVAIAMLIKATTPTTELPEELENTPEEIAKLPDVLAADTVKAATAAQMDLALSNVNKNLSDKFVTMTNEQSVEAAGVYVITASETGYTYKVMSAYVGFGAVGTDYEYPSLLDASVVTKKSSTEVTKTTTDPDHATQIDDVVEYTITAYFPYFDPNATDKTFTITDKIDGAEYVLDNAQVTVGANKTYDKTKFDTSVDVPENYDDAFEIVLTDLIDEVNTYANQLVTVTYKAKITEVDTTNTAVTHIPGVEVDEKTVNLYTGKIELTKTDDNAVAEERIGLADAEFTLVKVAADGSYSAEYTFVERQPKEGEDTATRYYTYDAEAQNVEGRTAETLITGSNGKLVVEGLNVGEYHFTETKAPKGYSINEDGANVELPEFVDDETTEDVNEGIAVAIFSANGSITDTKLLALPSTGGIGTTIFTVAGCAIMIAAAFFLFVNRKKEQA